MQDKTMQQLLDFFERNNDLLVFGMNGSKTNAAIPDDCFKDYDVVFFTEEVSKYKENQDFLAQFGEVLLYTEPELDAVTPLFPNGDGYIYLVQYTNGVRIDCQFRSLASLAAYLEEDSLTLIMGDKEGLVETNPIPDDSDYWLKRPTQLSYEQSIKEFWWEFNNTLKATIRGELLLAQFYLNLTRAELIQLMTWTIACDNGYEMNYGKQHTRVLDYLCDSEREQLLQTFDTGSQEKIFSALKQMKALEEKYMPLLSRASGFRFEQLTALNEVPTKYLKSKNQAKLAAYFE